MCLRMCSAEEIYQRDEVEKGSINNFETNKENQLFSSLAIKRFERSAANKEMNKPDTIRPPIILY